MKLTTKIMASIGARLSACALGFATALPAGLAGKRFGEKRTVLFGLGLMALGGFVMAGAEGFWIAGFGRLMVGVGGVVITVAMV